MPPKLPDAAEAPPVAAPEAPKDDTPQADPAEEAAAVAAAEQLVKEGSSASSPKAGLEDIADGPDHEGMAEQAAAEAHGNVDPAFLAQQSRVQAGEAVSATTTPDTTSGGNRSEGKPVDWTNMSPDIRDQAEAVAAAGGPARPDVVSDTSRSEDSTRTLPDAQPVDWTNMSPDIRAQAQAAGNVRPDSTPAATPTPDATPPSPRVDLPAAQPVDWTNMSPDIRAQAEAVRAAGGPTRPDSTSITSPTADTAPRDLPDAQPVDWTNMSPDIRAQAQAAGNVRPDTSTAASDVAPAATSLPLPDATPVDWTNMSPDIRAQAEAVAAAGGPTRPETTSTSTDTTTVDTPARARRRGGILNPLNWGGRGVSSTPDTTPPSPRTGLPNAQPVDWTNMSPDIRAQAQAVDAAGGPAGAGAAVTPDTSVTASDDSFIGDGAVRIDTPDASGAPAGASTVDVDGPIGDGAVRVVDGSDAASAPVSSSPDAGGTGATIDVSGPIGDGAVQMVDGTNPVAAPDAAPVGPVASSTPDTSGPIGGDPRMATPEQQRAGQVAEQRRLLEAGRPIKKEFIFPENMGLWDKNNGQETPATQTANEQMTQEKTRLLTKVKDVLLNRSKTWAEKFNVLTKAGRESKNGKAYILGALLGGAQGVSTTALGPLGLPLRFGLSMAINYGASRLMSRYGDVSSKEVRRTFEDRARVVVQGKNEADWNDEDKAAIKTDREKYELKLQEGRKRVKSFVQGFAAGGTLGSLGVAGFETIMANSMKEFFADRVTDVKNFGGNVAGAVGDGVRTPLQGNEQPDGLGSSAPSEVVVQAPVALEAPFTSVDIKPGDTVTSILRNSGVDVSDPSQYYGSMGETLKNSWDKFAADRAQMGFGDMPFPRDQLQTVIDQSLAGDAAAQSKLTEALHWIKAGDKLPIPTAKAAA